jgi:hypothetical protein
MPDFQEYHALRGVRDAKLFRDREAHDPDDAIPPVDDDRHPISLIPWDFAVDQEILQFPPSGRSQGAKAVPRAPAADGEGQFERPRRDTYFHTPCRP